MRSMLTEAPRLPGTSPILVAVVGLMLLAGCGTFSNDPRARTPGTIFDDNALEQVVKREIRASDPGFQTAHLVVVSHNGVVLLVGQVETEALKSKATQIAEGVAKVRKFHNELEIGGPTSFFARSNDSWLTSKVKTKLIRNEITDADTINVQTENGVVYLMGMIPRDQADEAVNVVRSVYGVQKIVKVFEYPD